MSKMAKLLTGLLAATAFSAGAQAAAIQLEVDQPTQMKFSDYEIGLHPSTQGTQGAFLVGSKYYTLVSGNFAVGDKLFGLANITSIGTTAQPNDLSAQLTGTSGTQLTGVFQLTVSNCGSGGCASTSGFTNSHMDFSLGTGDFVRLYTGAFGTIDPKAYDGSAAGLAAAIASAQGASWLQVNGPADNSISGTPAGLGSAPAYLGYSNSINIALPGGGNLTGTTNENWANADVNNTGYKLVPQLWPGGSVALSGNNEYCTTAPCPANLFTPIDPLGLISEVWFQSILNFNANTGANGSWQFISQDPLLLYTVPDPATLLLLGTGLIGLGLFSKKRLSA